MLTGKHGRREVRTATLVGISAVIWVGGAMIYEQFTVAAVFAVGHVLFWQNHALEVKINKLLDDRGLYVSRDEIQG